MPTQAQCENRGRIVTEDIVSAESIHNWQEFDQQNDEQELICFAYSNIKG